MFKGRQLSGAIDLKTTFNNADIIREGNNFDEILAGLTMQPSEAYDTNFVEDVSLLIWLNFTMKKLCCSWKKYPGDSYCWERRVGLKD